jgi:hypothetical protein
MDEAMQDRYTGDVGDFGKLGLLRALCARNDLPLLRLGVVWYLVPDESHNEDGKHTKYLGSPLRYRECDPELYDGLRHLLLDDCGRLAPGRRCVRSLGDSGLLPTTAVLFGEQLVYPHASRYAARMSIRGEWLAHAMTVTARAEVVFLDPDNGIECKSISRTSRSGPKYVYWDEFSAFADRGQTVILYHHLSRVCPSAEQMNQLRIQFKHRVPPGFTTLDVVFTRGTRRAYFNSAAPRHRDVLNRRIESMLATPWARHFARID